MSSPRPDLLVRTAHAAVVAAVLLLPLLYGFRVIVDVPLLDDWSFLAALQRHLAGETSLPEYLLARHNEHPAVPSRLVFLVLYQVAGLDLRVLRWLSIATWFLVAWLVTRAVRQDLGAASLGPVHRRLLLLPCLCVPLSLAGWETISLAMTFANAFSLLATLWAVFAFDRWCRLGSALWFAATCTGALLATVSLASGLLLWLLFAAVATWRFRFAERRGATAVWWLVGILLLAMQARVPLATPSSGAIEPLRALHGVAMVAGMPVTWPGRIGSTVGLVVGGVLVATAVVACWRQVRSRGESRAHLTKYVLLGVAGLLVAGLIAFARHGDDAGRTFAASRHVPMVLPLLLGGYGWAAVAGLGSRAGRWTAIAGAVLLVLSTAVADVVEYRMWRGRADAFREMLRCLETEDVATLPDEVWRTRFYLDPRFAPEVASVVRFLRTERLSFCR